MVLYTNDNKKYEIKWAEYWDENERFILAETVDNKTIKIELENFNKIEEK